MFDPRPRGRRAVILVVDDDLAVLDSLRTLLSGSYDVLEAAEGATALRIMGAAHVDLVILDLLMPGLDGFQILESLRRTHPATRSIVLTALDETKAAASAMKLGAVDFVVKPFETDEFLALVDRMVAARIGPRPPSSATAVFIVAADVGLRASLAVLLGVRVPVATAGLSMSTAHGAATGRPPVIVARLPRSSSERGAVLARLDAMFPASPALLLTPADVPCDRSESGHVLMREPVSAARLTVEIARLLEVFAGTTGWRGVGGLAGAVIDYVREHHAVASVDDIVRAVGVSPRHLVERFRDETELTLREYLARTRVTVASYLIRETDLSLPAIADRLGYYDPAHFSNQFTRHFGMPPGTYRRLGGRPMTE